MLCTLEIHRLLCWSASFYLHFILNLFQVKLQVYREYVKAVGTILSILICFLYGAQSAASIGANIWLTVWTNDTKNPDREDNVQMRVGVYAALGITQGMAQVTDCHGD